MYLARFPESAWSVLPVLSLERLAIFRRQSVCATKFERLPPESSSGGGVAVLSAGFRSPEWSVPSILDHAVRILSALLVACFIAILPNYAYAATSQGCTDINNGNLNGSFDPNPAGSSEDGYVNGVEQNPGFPVTYRRVTDPFSQGDTLNYSYTISTTNGATTSLSVRYNNGAIHNVFPVFGSSTSGSGSYSVDVNGQGTFVLASVRP